MGCYDSLASADGERTNSVHMHEPNSLQEPDILPVPVNVGAASPSMPAPRLDRDMQCTLACVSCSGSCTGSQYCYIKQAALWTCQQVMLHAERLSSMQRPVHVWLQTPENAYLALAAFRKPCGATMKPLGLEWCLQNHGASGCTAPPTIHQAPLNLKL